MVRPIPYKGNDPYIFISYAHRDSAQVWPIIQMLQQEGLKVWYDEGIDPGTEWDEFIATHIEQCGYFIAFLSRNYLDSENCKDELNFVRDLGKDRLLVYLEDAPLPSGMRMRLGRLQAIHWYNYPDQTQAFAKLMETPELTQFRLEAAAPIPEGKTQNIDRKPAQKSVEQTRLTAEEYYRRGMTAYGQRQYEQAVPDLAKAAEAGLPQAQFQLGLCFSTGTGVEKDLHAAVVCYRQSAKQGYAEAQNSLAVCYANGQGVPQDEAEAVVWFWKAAQQNNPRAQYNLGRRYAAGLGVAKNDETAIALLRKAADQGHAEARRLLAQGYHMKEYL